MKQSGKHLSLDAPFVETEENTLQDVLTDEENTEADVQLDRESLSTEIHRTLALLPEREREILKMFYGIDRPEMTLEEIGMRFGLSRERVRQIKEKTLKKLRHTSYNGLLKTFLGK